MALFHCDFYSEILNISTSMYVILPQLPANVVRDPQTKPQTLYLLHGMSDDHTTWHHQTSIARYVTNKDLAVIMPNVSRSFYTDMAQGYRYWTFLSEELPAIVKNFFDVSQAREDTFVAGLSMGGYGALKWALTYPDRFAAVASLSGALDIVDGPPKDDAKLQAELRLIFGDLEELGNSPNDLFYLAQQLSQSQDPKPKIYQWCGLDDYLYHDNLKFRDSLESLSLELTYKEGIGDHNWQYWDQQIQHVLEWLPLRSTQSLK